MKDLLQKRADINSEINKKFRAELLQDCNIIPAKGTTPAHFKKHQITLFGGHYMMYTNINNGIIEATFLILPDDQYKGYIQRYDVTIRKKVEFGLSSGIQSYKIISVKG